MIPGTNKRFRAYDQLSIGAFKVPGVYTALLDNHALVMSLCMQRDNRAIAKSPPNCQSSQTLQN